MVVNISENKNTVDLKPAWNDFSDYSDYAGQNISDAQILYEEWLILKH